MKRLVLLMLTLILSLALIACDDLDGADSSSGSDVETNESSDKTGSADEDEGEDEAEESGNLSIGDTAEFDDAKFTLKEVTTTDERNEFADEDPTAVIKIEYELENTSEDDLPYGADITVYDDEGNQMESYPLDNDMGSLAPGKKIQGAEHHGVDALGTIEIHFAPLISFESAAVFEVTIE